jgi:DNA replication protein DnaC
MKKVSFHKFIATVETKYDCEMCHDKGLVIGDEKNFFIKDIDIKDIKKIIYYKKCSCAIKREFESRMNRSGMGAILDKIMNEEYKTKYQWQKDYYKSMKEYVVNDVNGFIISGQTGSGKTLLMGKALLNFIHLGRESFYFDWHNDFNKKVVDRYKAINWDLVDYMCSVDVLYIDDLLKTRNNDLNDLYKRQDEIMIARTIIDKRCTDKSKKTIISTEWNQDDFYSIDKSLHRRMLELTISKEHWKIMPTSDKEDRNISVAKFNGEF